MNRRDFVKFAGVSWFSFFLPKGLQMSTYTELMMKIADGQTLDAIEREQLRQYAGEMESNNQIVSSWMQLNKNIDSRYLELPFNIIQSSVLNVSVASMTIEIPSNYKHLLIFSSGRTTTGGTGLESLLARYNSDSSTSYENQVLYGIGSAAGSQTSAVNTYAIIGGLSRDGEASGMCGSGFVFIPNYKGDLYKSALSLVNPGASTNIFMQSNVWKNTGSINSITISSSAGNLKQGCIISVYGIK